MSSTRHPGPDLPIERRQVTVLFCDIVGSTAFGRGKDDEDVLDLLLTYQRGAAEIVARFGGYVAKYMGDGILAYFGYPESHEDDAERAVRAGLALAGAVERLTAPGLQLRVGIATGLVVIGALVGSGLAEERAVVGDAPNLAARLQAIALPGTVVIAEQTRRLVGGLFTCCPIGPVPLKGFAEPQPAWQVTGDGAAASRFEALRAASLTPLVGRTGEIAALQSLWERARDGHGQVVLVRGEPGIGKSRLIAALREQEWMRDVPHTELHFDCLPLNTVSVLHPFIAQLEHAAGLHGAAGAERRLCKLEAALAPAGLPGESVALLADLLSIPTGGRYPAPDLAPQRRRERTAEAFLALVLGLAQQRPVLLVFEDAHWSDEASREVLSLIASHVPGHRVLAVVTARPEFHPPWAAAEQLHLGVLTLEHLGSADSRTIARWIVGADALAQDIIGDVVKRAGGNPLFIEELARALLAVGAVAGTGAEAIPFTLHASLTARLDRLGPAARDVAQIAAVIGRDTSPALLAAISMLDASSLDAAFQELTGSGLLLRRPAGDSDAGYAFKHALMQDAAYGALLRRRRRELHARVAGAIETVEPTTVEREPQALAHHCTEGELFKEAVAYRLKAGVLAFKRSALAESVGQLEAGVALLDRVTDADTRAAQAFDLQMGLAGVLYNSRGPADPSVGEAYAKARTLCRGVATPRQATQLMIGEFGHHLTRGQLRPALAIAEELEKQAARSGDEVLACCGPACRGMALAHMGALTAASDSLHTAAVLMDKLEPAALSGAYGEVLLISRGYLAWVLAARGCLDQACARDAELLCAAPLASRTLSAARASCFSVWLSQLRRDPDAARPRIDPLVRLCDEHGYGYWHVVSLMAKGWLVAEAGDVANGIALLKQSLAAYRSIGSETLHSMATIPLAEALTRAGRAGEAIAALDEGLALDAGNGDRWHEAEMLRLKGEALVASGRGDAGEQCLAAAVQVAREQGALLWELRASVRLADLWRDRSRRAEARDLLRPIYDRFREGLDSSDLRAARALLAIVEA